jgi:hypothetical protein
MRQSAKRARPVTSLRESGRRIMRSLDPATAPRTRTKASATHASRSWVGTAAERDRSGDRARLRAGQGRDTESERARIHRETASERRLVRRWARGSTTGVRPLTEGLRRANKRLQLNCEPEPLAFGFDGAG